MVAHTALFWLASQGAESDVPLNVFLSNLAGSASILCWFIVFTPQFWVNYKRQSGESLSLVFLYIWLAGDIMNLIGALMMNLLLTMRILAWYYAVADIALILQIYYYRRTSVKGSFESVITHAPEAVAHHGHGEHAGLISGASGPNYSSISPSDHVHENEHDRVIHKAAMAANATAAHYDDHHSIPTSGHRQRRLSSHSALTTGSGHYRSKVARRRKMVRKTLLIVFPLVIIGFFLWAYHDWLQCTIGHGDSEEGNDCGRGGGHGKLPPSPRPPTTDDEILNIMTGKKNKAPSPPTEDDTGFLKTTLPLLLGWGSAILYLGSRGPQIYKNWRLKSCEGLSVMMFVFSVFGNVFYVASIFLYSLELDYLIKNLPWWLGSGGTLIFDFTIFFQFYIYRHNQPLSEALKEAATAGELDENALIAAAEVDDASSDEESDSSSETLLQKNKDNLQQGASSTSTNV